MRKLRVMHILNTGGYSGAENIVITIINSMKSKIDGFYVSPKGNIEKILFDKKINYVPINDDHITVIELKRAIKKIRPDIIHAHDFMAGVVAACSSFGIPIINHLHNNSPWIKDFSLKSIIYGISALRFEKILTVSDSVMNEYIFGKLFKNKTTVVGNPINLQDIIEKSLSSNINDESDVIFLGRLDTQKNPLMFVDIVAEISKKTNIKAVMVGDGSLRQKVEDTIKNNGLEKNIILYGFQENPHGLLKNSKVMCMPSLWEGFGLAAVEALTLGKPVIAAPVGGLKNIINDNCGLICNSQQEYVDELLMLLSDSEYYQKKACGALIRSHDFDNIKSYRQMMIQTYKSLL